MLLLSFWLVKDFEKIDQNIAIKQRLDNKYINLQDLHTIKELFLQLTHF
mgnify:CR=1 FL=1